MEYKSAATRRMEQYYQDSDFHCEFRYAPLYGLKQEEGVTRRDPTSVIFEEGLYHMWYTRSVGHHFGFRSGNDEAKTWPWDLADLWHATSPDGWFWQEEGPAVVRGERGAYDDRSVFTPEILRHEGKFYLVYQVVQHPYYLANFESIAMASADSPFGPWTKTPAPILKPNRPEGLTHDPHNPLKGDVSGNFDDLHLHDPCLFFREGQFWLYYKGEHVGEEFNLGGRDIRWGVAMSDKAEGPYVRSPWNPISNTGHETLLWPYKEGMVGMPTKDGPEAETIQYAPDGLNFEIKARICDPPIAGGLFRDTETESTPLAGIKWGVCHNVSNGFGYIMRFDTVQSSKIRQLAQEKDR